MSYGRSAEAVQCQLVSLGALLRVVFLHGNARSLSIASSSSRNISLVGASFSTVPHAKMLSILEDSTFTEGGFNRLMRLAWLVYATHHPSRSPGISLKITANTDDGPLNAAKVEYMQELFQAWIPQRDVVHDVLATRYTNGPVQVDCSSLGSTVLVAAGTMLYCEPCRREIDYAVASLVSDECVDAVAHVLSDSSVGVVYPGYGLVWVAWSTITWVQNAEPDAGKGEATHHPASLGELATLSSLTLHLGDYLTQNHNRSLQVLRVFLGTPLRSLELSRADLRRDALRNILHLCPQLQAVVLRSCTVENRSPLVDAYTSIRGCCVSSLTFAGVIVSFTPIFDALGDPQHPVAFVLRELHVDFSALPPDSDAVEFKKCLAALEAPRVRLQRVTLKVNGFHRFPQAMRSRLRRLKRRRLSDPPASVVLATLNVLRVRAPQGYDQGVARTVLWFVGGSKTLSVACA